MHICNFARKKRNRHLPIAAGNGVKILGSLGLNVGSYIKHSNSILLFYTISGWYGTAGASNGVTGFDSPPATNSVKLKSPKAEVTEPLTGIT
nr:MAG TPA: hypothetical protein [Caudoviricetes sp.]